MRQLRRLTEMSWADRFALVRMAVLLMAMRVLLWIVPFRWIRHVLERSIRTTPCVASDVARAYVERTAWAARVIGRRLLGDKPCLTQALVVRWLLGRRGLAADLRIGVTKQEGRLMAHAWIEYEGRIIVGGWRSPFAYASLQPLQPSQGTSAVSSTERSGLCASPLSE